MFIIEMEGLFKIKHFKKSKNQGRSLRAPKYIKIAKTWFLNEELLTTLTLNLEGFDKPHLEYQYVGWLYMQLSHS